MCFLIANYEFLTLIAMFYNLYILIRQKTYASQSYHFHLFFACVFDSAKLKLYIQRFKDITDTIKHIRQLTSWYTLDKSCDRLKLDSSADDKKKNLEKNAYCISFPICHKFWDIELSLSFAHYHPSHFCVFDWYANWLNMM